MKEQFSRSALLIGEDGLRKLKQSKVAIFGVGGVGGYACEALARSGIGHFLLVDSDDVNLSNLNRQIIATLDTVKKSKVEVMKERILSINKDAEVEIKKCFFLPENENEFNFKEYDYIVDAVDTVTAKVSLVVNANKYGVKIISALGAGNKINPTYLEVSDIYKTKVDPLAKAMRTALKKRNINSLKVVYSREKPIKLLKEIRSEDGKKVIPGSMIFVPSCMGLIIASEIVKDITGIKNEGVGA